ncbi:uncharacterized protein LOC117117687 [Anneissia japonica]|uniref:uncharacterized protein LOC117117687 n=1 Tax=Anneissia japonica TaxID=1529436 RepID=UPI001425B7D4|nr:uncharacterized protein LOC117117687 [Anneissia japonica]
MVPLCLTCSKSFMFLNQLGQSCSINAIYLVTTLRCMTLATKDGNCYFAHEGQTRRGSCEIASYLYTYLQEMDTKGVEKMDFFSDGCIGQNKNSVIPAMMMYFIESSKSIQEITLNFFETNHVQSEGDSIHSTIERAINQVSEIALPFQVVSIISMARKRPKPYTVIPTKSADIKDWKTLSQKKGILRVRYAESGKNIDWTKFMQVQVKKNEPETVRFKYSHLDKEYEVINLSNSMRRQSESSDVESPQNLYKAGYPRLSEAKYQDLQSLCSGPTPVLSHPEYQTFYRQLNH